MRRIAYALFGTEARAVLVGLFVGLVILVTVAALKGA